MDRLIYTAASGLNATMRAQAAIANNMANVSTIGFRAEKINFDSVMIKGPRFETREPTSAEVTDFDRSAGTIVTTGRPLDVAIPGDQWLSVQAADGAEAYTRRGDLQVSESGTLSTGDGYPVVGSSGSPITLPPYDKLTIGGDGTISIVPQGGDPKDAQVIDKLKLVSPKGSDTAKGLDNLIRVKGGGTLPEDLDAKIESGALEQSNVNMTQALVDMLENQRGYEVQVNLLKSARDMDEGGASTMRLSA